MRKSKNEAMPVLPQQVASEETIARYLIDGARLAKQLWPDDETRTTSSIAAAFVMRAEQGQWADSTIRLYKRRLLEYLPSLPSHSPLDLEAVRNVDSLHNASSEAHTSGLKLRKISSEESGELLNFMRTKLSGGQSEIGRRTADFFETLLIIGCRPVELLDLSFEPIKDSDKSLVPSLFFNQTDKLSHKATILNAKHNNIRGNGEQRVIFLTLSIDQALCISRCLAAAQVMQARWPRFYRQMCSSLKYSSKRIWPRRKKHPCLYTARHQAVANSKAAGMPADAIAAVFGHASYRTARKNYAPRTFGDKSLCIVIPSELSLDAVRLKNPLSEQHSDAEISGAFKDVDE